MLQGDVRLGSTIGGNMTRKVELLMAMFGLLGGCTFHASVQAGTRSGSHGELAADSEHVSGSESRARVHGRSNHHVELAAKDESPSNQPPAPAPAQPVTKAAKPARETPKPVAHAAVHTPPPQRPVVEQAKLAQAPAPSAAPSPANDKRASATEGDHDRGHGNDADRIDEDNPGKSKGGKGK